MHANSFATTQVLPGITGYDEIRSFGLIKMILVFPEKAESVGGSLTSPAKPPPPQSSP